ncbi:14 kDa proline-rich protein DC2.15 [Melia azedarach]|uniref:14 kDa proline-rich protein DC2.15 n=1 Tax=Melia azedarach TaxID=155640 RepID=A0ACC1X2A6_MELAZ|nr:14 kDa proline-rich protein DC2.15 [Melia azedarach]
MASRASSSSIALLLSLNLLFFTFLTSLPSSSATDYNNNNNANNCPENTTLRLDVCADVLKNLVKLRVGEPPKPCCKLIGDLVRLEARACLCTSLKLKLLDLVKLEVPNLHLNLLLSRCDTGIKCP